MHREAVARDLRHAVQQHAGRHYRQHPVGRTVLRPGEDLHERLRQHRQSEGDRHRGHRVVACELGLDLLGELLTLLLEGVYHDRPDGHEQWQGDEVHDLVTEAVGGSVQSHLASALAQPDDVAVRQDEDPGRHGGGNHWRAVRSELARCASGEVPGRDASLGAHEVQRNRNQGQVAQRDAGENAVGAPARYGHEVDGEDRSQDRRGDRQNRKTARAVRGAQDLLLHRDELADRKAGDSDGQQPLDARRQPAPEQHHPCCRAGPNR